MKGGAAIILAAFLALSVTGCESEAEYLKRKAETVRVCVDSGGEWYNTPGWGEACHFDSRKDGR